MLFTAAIKKPGLCHSFVTQVLGAGGATFWFLSFIAIAATCTFNPLILILVPAVIMTVFAARWGYENSNAIKTCLVSFPSK